MLNSVTITSNRASLTFDLRSDDSGYIVENIEGLGPVKAELTSTTYASFDGDRFQSARRGTRNIVMTIKISPYFNVEALRDLIYAAVMPKDEVTFQVNKNGSLYSIAGYVESVEPVIFSKDPKLTISIICFQPDFMEPYASTVIGSANSETVINYNGTIPSGFVLTLSKADTNVVSNAYIQSIANGVTNRYTFVGDILLGAPIIVDTNVGSRGITSSSYSYLTHVDEDSVWIQLQPGPNKFKVVGTSTGAALEWSLVFNNRFGAI